MVPFACLLFGLQQPIPRAAVTRAIDAMKWDVARRGPLLALEPSKVTARTTSFQLAAFGRMLVRVGGVSAIVPTTMTIIDEADKVKPNLYDGLSRPDKLLYLVTTLDDGQWRKATTDGIGFSDLSDEQRKVYDSFLARPFKVSYTSTESDRLFGKDLGRETLSDDDRNAVKIKFQKGVLLQLQLPGTNSIVHADSSAFMGEPGKKIAVPEFDDFRPDSSFGVLQRLTLPNAQKKGDLDFDDPRLKRSVTLAPKETIDSALDRVGRATGLELHADFRVGERELVSLGATAKCADLLRSVALMVTGVYRHVGPVYHLTSDLTGLGSRRLRLAYRDDATQQAAFKLSNDWRAAIVNSGRYDGLAYDDHDPLRPSADLTKSMDASGTYGPTKLTAADLSPGMLRMIDQFNLEYKSQQVTPNGARVSSTIDFHYVLPNGMVTCREHESLGYSELFKGFGGPPPRTDAAFTKQDASKAGFALHERVANDGEARAAIDRAARYGVSQVWIETWDLSSLRTAIAAGKEKGVSVVLATRPFGLDAATVASSDLNLALEPGPTVIARLRQTSEWDMIGRSNLFAPYPHASISPDSAEFATRLRRLAELAKEPGLAQVALLEIQPSGYEGPRVEWYSVPGPPFKEMTNWGFGLENRLEFIREHAIDPIDLVPPNLHANSDIRQPFFLDDRLRGSRSSYDGTDSPHPRLESMSTIWPTRLAEIGKDMRFRVFAVVDRARPSGSLCEPIIDKMNDDRAPAIASLRKPGEEARSLRMRAPSPPDAGPGAMRFTLHERHAMERRSLVMFPQNPAFGSRTFVIDLTDLSPKMRDAWLESVFVSK